MKATVATLMTQDMSQDWVELARELGDQFAERAAEHDETSGFVSENYQELRGHKFFSAGVPAELGGGGATHEELCNVIRELGRHCGSTALAFSMHTHPVAANVFKYLRGDDTAEKTLKKIAANELAIANTGANDWLDSSGKAERVDGGYRVTARKRFVSGAPGAQVLASTAIYAGDNGREALHFAIPITAEGVSIIETWRTIGMRGTGSHDVSLENVFVPEEAIVARRPVGVWHPMWDVIIPIAMPLITSAYVGLAEAAVDLAKAAAKRKPGELAPVVGEMMNKLTIAQMALAGMIGGVDNYGFTPGLANTNETFVRKAIAADAVKETVELAAEIVGGPGFFRGHAMERIVRDIRAMHFHPLPVRRQQVFSGRIALGLDPVDPS